MSVEKRENNVKSDENNVFQKNLEVRFFQLSRGLTLNWKFQEPRIKKWRNLAII